MIPNREEITAQIETYYFDLRRRRPIAFEMTCLGILCAGMLALYVGCLIYDQTRAGWPWFY